MAHMRLCGIQIKRATGQYVGRFEHSSHGVTTGCPDVLGERADTTDLQRGGFESTLACRRPHHYTRGAAAPKDIGTALQDMSLDRYVLYFLCSQVLWLRHMCICMYALCRYVDMHTRPPTTTPTKACF